jgi:hypothetical protein
MIRRALLAVALLAGSATAASSEIVFVGTIKITAQTAQCQRNRVNEYANSAFHPAAVGGNDNFAGLSWVWTHYSRGHGLPGRNFDATFRVVQTGGVGWGDPYIVDAARQSQIRIISSVPAVSAITAATPALQMTGQIRRFDDDPGGLACVFNFIANYVKDSRQ